MMTKIMRRKKMNNQIDLFSIVHDTTTLRSKVYDYLTAFCVGKAHVQSADTIAFELSMIHGCALTRTNIYHAVKTIRLDHQPKFQYRIKSCKDGYFVMKRGDAPMQDADIEQVVGGIKNTILSGRVSPAYYHRILNDLESQCIVAGQQDSSNNIYRKEVNG